MKSSLQTTYIMIIYNHRKQPHNEGRINMNINLTENSFIYQSAKRLLNRELEKCFKLLKDNEKKWNEFMDLKLHQASYGVDISFKCNDATVSFDDNAYVFYFNEFCDISYEQFIEDCRENLNTDYLELRDAIGRTSSFYLGTLHNSYSDNHYITALAQASSAFNLSDIEFNEDEKGIHIIEDGVEDVESFVNSMLELVEDMYEQLEDIMNQITAVYDYIADFKEHQEELFKEFVENSWLANIN